MARPSPRPASAVALLTLLLLVAMAAPALPLAPACPMGEARVVPLPAGPTTVCVFDVPLLAPDARIVQQTAGGQADLPRAGIRTLGGTVAGVPASFVRLVEGPGYLAGVVRTVDTWFWLHPDGPVRTQAWQATHSPYAEPGGLGLPSPPTTVRVLVQADSGFLADRGAPWHLYALTVLNVVDGAFRAQAGVGWQVAGLTGGNVALGPLQREVDLVLAGSVPGFTPLGYASLSAVYLGPFGGPGVAWVRTSAALARPVSCYGGPYEGTLYGNVAVAMHELGHTLDLPWVASPVLNLPAHDPWYYCTQDMFSQLLPWFCTSMGGWHGEANNCMEILAPRRPVYAGDGVLAPVSRVAGLEAARGHHVDA
jgi:hypothetical protein